ncbi:glycoside hydrolase superfamily [Infundibulicybe gibba]|nr:glycoside hydrolase superfamily [Infundibulicybe gibba]
MIFLSFSRLVILIFVALFTGRVGAVPLNETSNGGLDHQAREILARASPAFCRLWDAWDGVTGPPTTSAIKAQEWQSLSEAERNTIKSQYAAAGIKLMVSAFGSADIPTGSDPVALANQMSGWVKQYKLDGIDVDYEDFDAFNAGNGQAESMAPELADQLHEAASRSAPPGKLYHYPRPFQPNRWGGGGYLKVHQSVGNLIDWYNVQFYNQGISEYTTCSGLLTASSGAWPGTSVFQIAASGVPLSKIVVGKPATSGDANNGYIPPSTLATCLQQGKNQGWMIPLPDGGAMVWQYPRATPAWIQTVRSLSWPV